ncbi:MAG: PQQ-binding-like beta-propeller repeat protein [Planctomycetota bacterium]
MIHPLCAPLLLASVLALPAPLTSVELADEHWPQWRGPLGTGESKHADPPLEWDDEKNIRWKAEIPGAGKGTPIIWGDLVFVLTAEGFGEEVQPEEPEGGGGGRRGGRRGGGMKKIQPTQKQRFTILALNRSDGSVAWQAVAREALPHEGTHGDASWASGSALTDGRRLFAHFGSNGLFAYDLAGKKLWETDLGQMRTRNGFGEGSSPAVHGDTLVVQWDHEGPSFIVALNANTGEELWRRERDEPTSWATPLIVEVDGKPQVITNGTNKIRSYDLASGEIVWECGGMTLNAIPSPVYADGVVYLMSGFRGNALLAIRLDGAKGDITDTDAVLWQHDRDTPYVPSPLLVEGQLYFFKGNTGILSAHDVASGEAAFGPERLESVANVYASPVAAAGRIYLVSRDGETEVLEPGSDYKVLATNVLEDSFDASPAVVGDELYLRGAKHVYCIAEAAGE